MEIKEGGVTHEEDLLAPIQVPICKVLRNTSFGAHGARRAVQAWHDLGHVKEVVVVRAEVRVLLHSDKNGMSGFRSRPLEVYE